MIDINKSQNVSSSFFSSSEQQPHSKTSNTNIYSKTNIKIIKFNKPTNIINTQKSFKFKLPALNNNKILKRCQINNLLHKSNSFNNINSSNTANRLKKNLNILKTPLKNNSCNFGRNIEYNNKLQTPFFKSSFSSTDCLDNNSTKNANGTNLTNIFGDILPKKFLTKLKNKSPINFHRTLMNSFEIKQNKIINSFYNKIKIEENEKYIKGILENKKEIKTGIYGPNNNIINVIRARMERIKYDRQYKVKDQEIKDIIEDEILDAQVKLKRKAIKINLNDYTKESPLYMQKIANYRYLKKCNNILFFNRQSKIPLIIEDGESVIKLVQDAVDVVKSKKYDLKTRDNIK